MLEGRFGPCAEDGVDHQSEDRAEGQAEDDIDYSTKDGAGHQSENKADW